MTTARTAGLTAFIVMDVLEKAHEMERDGVDVVHLEIGEPDFDMPQCVKNAACQALDAGYTHYTHSLGLPELREAISEYYQATYGVGVDPGNIIVSSGTSPAMFMLFAALVEPGEEVIISDPHYACYPNFIKFVGGIPVTVPVLEEDGFQYRPAAIQEKISSKTKGIFINYPSNPTGNMISPDRLEAIAKLGPHIVSDEIYHGLVYEGQEHSILEFTDRAFVLNGFSKLFAMTGMRLGYVIVPPEFVRPIQKIHQNFFISANAMVQKAGITALKEAGDDTARMRDTYDRRRRYMIARIKGLGLGITVEPTGAFYVFANAKHISGDSYALAFDILEKAHVGVAPGIDFGQQGEGYLRFSYATSMKNIEKGMDRLEKYFRDK